MEIIVIDQLCLNFKQVVDVDTKMLTHEWYAKGIFNDLELEFSFNEFLFKKLETDEIIIDWEVIRAILKNSITNLDSLIKQSENVLRSLYKEVFKSGEKDFDSKLIYFSLLGLNMSLISKNKYFDDYQFDLIFLLESEIDHLRDTYFTYYSTFRNLGSTLVITGVRREEA